jgi:uncharacterized membrane protein
MTLTPLLEASPAIQIHVATALAAFGLGLVQFLTRKGTPNHRVLGYLWVSLMAVTSAVSFGIQTINQWNGFSLIHLLSIFTLVMLIRGIVAVRRGNIRKHQLIMATTFVGALVIAGGFTLVPGRIMHKVVFGPAIASAD